MKYNLEQIELILTLFRLQNAERLITEFTHYDDFFQNIKVKDLILYRYQYMTSGLCALSVFKNGLRYDALYGSTVHGFRGLTNRGSRTPFNPLDYISFEDKV